MWVEQLRHILFKSSGGTKEHLSRQTQGNSGKVSINVNIFAKVHNSRELCEKSANKNIYYFVDFVDRELHSERIRLGTHGSHATNRNSRELLCFTGNRH